MLGFNWATGYAIASYCISHGMPSQSYMFWQSFGPFCIIGLSLLFKRKQAIKQHISIRKWGYCLVCALLGVILPSYISYFSLEYVDMGVIVLFANCTPFLIYLFVLALKLEKFDFFKMMIVFMATLSILYIVADSNASNLWLDINQISYKIIFLLFFIPLCYASISVFINKYKIDLTYSTRAFIMLLIASLAFLPLAISHGMYIPKLNDAVFYMLSLEIIISAINLLLVFYIISSKGAVYYSLVNGITAIVGIFYNYFLFNRHYTIMAAFAITCIVLAIIVISVLNVKNH
jgi:drug/metabolite transporter (DMT)-like permease